MLFRSFATGSAGAVCGDGGGDDGADGGGDGGSYSTTTLATLQAAKSAQRHVATTALSTRSQPSSIGAFTPSTRLRCVAAHPGFMVSTAATARESALSLLK